MPDSQNNGDAYAFRFDALIYKMEIANLNSKPYGRLKTDLINKAEELSKLATIPQVKNQIGLLNQIMRSNFIEEAKIIDFEKMRKDIRDLMQYLQRDGAVYYTNFADSIVDSSVHESEELKFTSLSDYKAKAEYYIKQHQDEKTINKLKSNQPLSSQDLLDLEDILWKEIGSKDDYQKEIGDQTPGQFVRSIIGLDMHSAKEAFAKYLDQVQLNAQQIYFVNEIIEYIVKNGTLTDMHVLQDAPFTNQGTAAELFENDIPTWQRILGAIDEINLNAGVKRA